MLQREVVERITARPGHSERGYLTVLVEASCESEALFDVPPGAFRPVPKVWSTVARLRVRESAASGLDERLFVRLVGACFAQKRKTILNNLRSAPEELRSRVESAGGVTALLEAAGVDPQRRAESLALEVDFCSAVAPAASARVVANLPYNISTAILQRLVAQRRCLPELVLMLQREVVERITARPGSSERGYLTVLVEAFCESEALFDVPPGAFRPVPKVWSTVARLRTRQGALSGRDELLFARLVGACFAQKRKTILNNLRSAPEGLRTLVGSDGGATALLEAAGVDPGRRAESLTPDEWVALVAALGARAG